MTTTTQVTVTKVWQQLHSDTCVVQALHSAEQFQFAGSAASPTNETGLYVRIIEPTEISLKGAVWCRLPPTSTTKSEKVIVVK